jgi:hypothetical protein
MHRFWQKIRTPLAILLLLMATVFMARLFSGPEDAWVRNGQGEWEAHGHPSAPMPDIDYHPPFMEQAFPWIFLAAFAVPLLLRGMHRIQNRLTFETAARDVRFYGYLGNALISFGALIGLGTAVEFAIAYDNLLSPRLQDLFVFVFLAGLSGLCILLGAISSLAKRNVNDHFHLERGRRELLEALERMREGK